MCLCDDKFFKLINVTTGKVKLYKRAAGIANRFNVTKDFVMRQLNRGPSFTDYEDVYKVEVNMHYECQVLRIKIKKYFKYSPSYLSHDQIEWFKKQVHEVENPETE